MFNGFIRGVGKSSLVGEWLVDAGLGYLRVDSTEIGMKNFKEQLSRLKVQHGPRASEDFFEGIHIRYLAQFTNVYHLEYVFILTKCMTGLCLTL